MNKALAKRSLIAATVASAAVAAPLTFVAPAGAAPSQSGTAVNCAEYAPVYITTNLPSVNAGQNVTVSGILLAGDTVTIKLIVGGQTVVLGTVTADANGRFTLTAPIPESTPSGSATIQASSPNCPSPLSTSIIVVGGTSTTVPNPPICSSTGASITFPAVKLIDWDGYNPKVEYTPVVAVNLAAGEWDIAEAVSWDSYPARATATKQTSEIWEIEFLSGSTVVARSAPTADLEDFVVTAEWRGSLGKVTLPSAVDGVRARHLPDQFPDVPWGQANSVFAVSATFCSTAEPTSTTGASSTTNAPTTTSGATSTTVAGTPTSSAATTPPSTGGLVGGDSTTPASVLGSSVTRVDGEVASSNATKNGSVAGKNLAWTGGSSGMLVRIASVMIAAGGLLALRFRRSEPAQR